MISGGSAHASHIRRSLLLLALVTALTLLWLRRPGLHTNGFGAVGSLDFLQYWGAARLLLWGRNPYDPSSLLAVQQAVGWPEPEPVLMWNPPWTLAVILPLGLLPFRLATQAWLLFQVGLTLVSGVFLWRYFAPGDAHYWAGPLLAAAFVPTLFALRMGQISPWLLAGIVAFLCAEREGRDLLAGSSLALLMIKPHFTYLFWLAALWRSWRRRRWRVLISWLAALMGASVLVLLLASDVFANYVSAAAAPPFYWATPTLGTWLRLLFGQGRHWLHVFPSLAGALGLAVWLYRRQRPWDWSRMTAPLLLVSALTTPYGWSHDQVVLLPVVMALMARLHSRSLTRRAAVLGSWAMSQLGLVAQNWLRMGEFLCIWHPLALAGLYWWGISQDPADGMGSASGEVG